MLEFACVHECVCTWCVCMCYMSACIVCVCAPVVWEHICTCCLCVSSNILSINHHPSVISIDLCENVPSLAFRCLAASGFPPAVLVALLFALTCTLSCLLHKLGAPWSSLSSFIVLTLLLLLSGLVCLPRPTRKFLNALRILHHWSQLHSPSQSSYLFCNLKNDCLDVSLKNVFPNPQIIFHFLPLSSIHVSPTEFSYHLLEIPLYFCFFYLSFSQYQPLKSSQLPFYPHPENHTSIWLPHSQSKWQPSSPRRAIENLFSFWQPLGTLYHYFLDLCDWADPTKYKRFPWTKMISHSSIYTPPERSSSPKTSFQRKPMMAYFLIVSKHIQMNHSILMFAGDPILIYHRSAIILEKSECFNFFK